MFLSDQRIRRALIIMVFGTFFGILCSTLMNIALPTFMDVFHISEAHVQWVTNGYMLVNALMIPVSSYLNVFHLNGYLSSLRGSFFAEP